MSVNKILFIFVVVFLLIFAGGTALAAPLNLDWPLSPLGTSLNKENPNLLVFVKYLYEWLISLGGLAAFISLIYAGLQYLTSAGDVGRMREGRERLKSASFGLGLLFGAYLILNTINPQLTVLKLPPSLLSTEIKGVDFDVDLSKNLKECKRVEVVNSAGESKSVNVDNKWSSGFPLLSATIYGSCEVKFYDNRDCKEKNLIHLENIFIFEEKEGEEPKPMVIPNLKEQVIQEKETYCVKVKQAKFPTF